jgi:DNA-binding response OmpR family regulator
MLVSRVLSAAGRPTSSAPPAPPAPPAIGNLTLDPATRRARTTDRDIALTSAEFVLLSALAAHPGRVLSRGRLQAATGPADRPSSARAVDVHIAQLRAKLGAELGAAIRTVRGVGYILDEPLNGAYTSSNRGVPAAPLTPPR